MATPDGKKPKEEEEGLTLKKRNDRQRSPTAIMHTAILSACRVQPPTAATDRESGMHFNILRPSRLFDWIASGIGSIQLLKHGVQKVVLLWDM